MYGDKSPRSASEGSDTADKRIERTSQRPRSQRPRHQDFMYNPPGSSQSRERSRDSSAPDTGRHKESDLLEGAGLHVPQADLIPTRVLRCHFEMWKIRHGTNKLRILFKMLQSMTKSINNCIKGGKCTVRKILFS